jgi:hypothetical protein
MRNLVRAERELRLSLSLGGTIRQKRKKGFLRKPTLMRGCVKNKRKFRAGRRRTIFRRSFNKIFSLLVLAVLKAKRAEGLKVPPRILSDRGRM